MIVYGDRSRREDAAALRDALAADLRGCVGAVGLDGHARLVGAFVRAGELAQGLADAESEQHGRDAPSDAQRAAARLLLHLARALDQSWRRGRGPDCPALRDALEAAETLPAAGWIVTRLAEGHAHYALYPEAYAEAARRSGLGPGTLVIGIRSIGIGLAAVVAAGLDAGPAISLRPRGHPFDRHIRADPALLGEAVPGDGPTVAVVDEGPGLSGSSFLAVVRWLRAHGVAQERIHLFPSHAGGPGAQAGPARQGLWAALRRHPACSQAILPGSNRNAAGAYGAFAPHPVWRDLSGGGWRALCHPDAPVLPGLERRKLLLAAGSRPLLMRFAGIGRLGSAKLRDAEILAASGLVPEPAGLRHGFLLERWHEGKSAAAPKLGDAGRADLVAFLARYIARRARSLPEHERGADAAELAAMAGHNATKALGAALGDRIARTAARLLPRLGCEPCMAIDGRLHRWEFVRAADGRLLKADAVDHGMAHDLIGGQPVTWDIAGAIIEHDLDEDEQEELVRRVSRVAGAPDPAGIAFARISYAAFQIGLWSLETPPDRAAAKAVAALTCRYRRHLKRFAES